MLKTAATELVYSSTIPARLAGNSDPKYLQEVIATEKLVLQSYVPGSTQATPIQTLRFQPPETQHRLWEIL